MPDFKLLPGKMEHILPWLPSNSVDAIVTDPPYGLKFMGKAWDYSVPTIKMWRECFRVLKPGGHLLAFAGTRTQHRMAVNIEDAGFEIRDMIAWVYGSGFPKSLDISKSIDKAAGADREIIGKKTTNTGMQGGNFANQSKSGEVDITAAATALAKEWDGWGTALKPALEPITVARKPFIGTVVENVLEYGTGGLNIDECRIGFKSKGGRWIAGNEKERYILGENIEANPKGRWPANFIHDGSADVLGSFPETKAGGDVSDDTGNAARFFYCAKASKEDRDAGLNGFLNRFSAAAEFRPNHMEKAINGEDGNPFGRWKPQKNHHPTVKPTDLMRYLCRLVTPVGGTILDPFCGSGSTGRGAVLEGFDFIGVEMTDEYIPIAEARILDAIKQYHNDHAQLSLL